VSRLSPFDLPFERIRFETSRFSGKFIADSASAGEAIAVLNHLGNSIFTGRG
jgi:hypothetical protein